MKKTVCLFVCLGLFFVGAASLSAQQGSGSKQSELYPVTIRVERVYPYRLGFVAAYKSGLKTVYAYIPNEWFEKGDPEKPAKAEKVLIGTGTEWPHLTIYYRNGKFERVKLFVRKDTRHESWGIISGTTDIDSQFENIEELTIEYPTKK